MKLCVMTGGFMTGKTTWITHMLSHAEKRGLAVGGVVCPAVFENGRKTGIDAVLLPSRVRIGYAQPRSGGFVDEKAQHGGVPANSEKLGWKFDESAMERINRNFASSAAANSDLLIVDELGPLELMRGEGYTEALKLLDAKTPPAVLAVIRPALLDAARERWGAFDQLTPESDIEAFLACLG